MTVSKAPGEATEGFESPKADKTTDRRGIAQHKVHQEKPGASCQSRDGRCNHTIYLEDFKTCNMTGSAKDTLEEPGTNLKHKTGLNREIPGCCRGILERYLDYGTEVVKIPSRYASQKYSRYGHTGKVGHKTQAGFSCACCRLEMNADHHAATNILACGIGAARRRGALAPVTPMSRQMDTVLSHGQGCI